jgi:hypothetical protein
LAVQVVVVVVAAVAVAAATARVRRGRRGAVAAPGASGGGAQAVVLEDETLQLPPDTLHLVRVEERRRLLLRIRRG